MSVPVHSFARLLEAHPITSTPSPGCWGMDPRAKLYMNTAMYRLTQLSASATAALDSLARLAIYINIYLSRKGSFFDIFLALSCKLLFDLLAGKQYKPGWRLDWNSFPANPPRCLAVLSMKQTSFVTCPVFLSNLFSRYWWLTRLGTSSALRGGLVYNITFCRKC